MTTRERAEHIVTVVKQKYIRDRIVLPGAVWDEIVILLARFDYEADIELAKHLISLEKEPIADWDMWLIFRGSELKKRWDEVVELTRENYGYVCTPMAAEELLRFLKANAPKELKEKK